VNHFIKLFITLMTERRVNPEWILRQQREDH
jgi:hypothetical protein